MQETWRIFATTYVVDEVIYGFFHATCEETGCPQDRALLDFKSVEVMTCRSESAARRVLGRLKGERRGLIVDLKHLASALKLDVPEGCDGSERVQIWWDFMEERWRAGGFGEGSIDLTDEWAPGAGAGAVIQDILDAEEGPGRKLP
jgi:hypothetical protein